jgi:hypothetical protein
MVARDITKSAVITLFGLFEFLRMPMNAKLRFQRPIDRVLAGLDFVFIYLDDMIVSSDRDEYRFCHLWLVFKRPQPSGLVLNMDNCSG